MRIVAFILCLMVMMACVLPCTDEQAKSHDIIEHAHAHGDHDHEEDSCSPFCVCSCCGSALFVFEVPSFDLQPSSYYLQKDDYNTYKSNFNSSYSHFFWQPPKLA